MIELKISRATPQRTRFLFVLAEEEEQDVTPRWQRQCKCSSEDVVLLHGGLQDIYRKEQEHVGLRKTQWNLCKADVEREILVADGTREQHPVETRR